MSEQGNEYDQYAPPQPNGRLFSSAMFGFNKEEVLEYLEEIAEENFQRQEAAEVRMQELNRKIKNLEVAAQEYQNAAQVPAQELDSSRQQMGQLAQELEVARTATQQAEEELQGFKEQLLNARKENEWLRGEHQKTDKTIAELRRQLDEASSGQWMDAEEQITELRRQLEIVESERDAAEAERDAAEAERDAALSSATGHSTTQASRTIIAEANDDADRIRNEAYAERDRLHRQIINSAGGLSESIVSLREDISSVEGDVTSVLETVQNTLADLLSTLGRTEQNLATLDIQVDRFPGSSPTVPKQQVVYFQPGAQMQPVEQPVRQHSPRRSSQGQQSQGSTSGGFRRVWPNNNSSSPSNTFKPTYTSGNAAPSSAYYPQAAEDLDLYEENREERLRNLSETLVGTLMEMLNET